jgi:AraC-like DNA-binding protein
MDDQKSKPSILDALTNARKSDTYEVYLPVAGKSVSFVPMSARQNKKLLAALVNEIKYQSEAPVVQHDILRSNLLTEDVNIETLAPADVQVCLIALRAYNYDQYYDIVETQGSEEVVIERVDLFKHLKSLKKVKLDDGYTQTLKHGDIEAVVGTYSYGLDTNLAIFMKTVLEIQERKGKKMSSSEQSDLFSEVVGLQILKHINRIKIGDVEQNLATTSVPDMNRIGDALSSAFFTKAAKAVVNFGKKAVDPVLKTEEGNEISVDPEFFIIKND